MSNKSVPVYGDGLNVRDWLHVEDHCRAIDLAFHKGVPGEVYNIAAQRAQEHRHHKLSCVMRQRRIVDQLCAGQTGTRQTLRDRFQQDQEKLNWEPLQHIRNRIHSTIDWYKATNNGSQPFPVKLSLLNRLKRRLHAGCSSSAVVG